MSITPFASLSIFCAGAAISYFSEEQKAQDKNVDSPKKEKTKIKSEKSSKTPKSTINAEKLDTFLLVIKGVKKTLKYSKKFIQQLKFVLNSGLTSINLSDWIRSPKAAESMILLLGTIGMVYSNFKPFKGQPSFFSKATTIGGSLLAESKGILTMHQLMLGISDLAKNRKPPIKELTIASLMILGSKMASRYSK